MRWVVLLVGLLTCPGLVAVLKERDSLEEEEEVSEEKAYDDYEDDVEIRPTIVCRRDQTDHCVCEEERGIINCRKSSTQNGRIRGTVPTPFESATIKTEDDDFKARFIILAGHAITYLDGATITPGQRLTVELFDFTNNQIRVIEESTFDNFPKLEKLRLSHNLLSLSSERDGWITDKLGDSLKKLYLDHNMLGRINDGVFDPLHKLETLVLDGNPHLTLSDQTFGQELQSLKALSLDKCGLQTLPNGLFANLKNLMSLSLIGNPIISVPSALAKLPALSYLDLSATELTEVAPKSFAANPKLVGVFMKDMKYLTAVDDCAFCGLSKLEKVVLSKNPQLYRINPNAFGFSSGGKAGHLKVVNLDNDNISTLDANTLDWKKLDALSLGNNPLACDSRLEWLIKDSSLHLTGDTVPKCAGPPEMRGVSIQKLHAQNAQLPSGVGSALATAVMFLLSVAVVGALGFALVLFCRRSHKANPFYRPTMPNVGFSNLSAQLEMDDEVMSLAEETVDIDKPTDV